jgi:hypothetical protein
MRCSFTEHPNSVGETYLEHTGVAWRFGFKLLLASLACFIHGLLPFLCVTTGSSTIRALYAEMVTHRRRDQAPAAAPEGTAT